MATPAEKLQILVIQHLEHAGIGEDVVGPVKEALEKSEKKGEGSTLYELFCSATGEGAPAPAPAGRKPSMQQQQQAPPQQQARMTQMQQQQQTRMSMQGQAAPRGSQMGGSVAYSAQQAAMIQQQAQVEQKPVIAKEPKVRDPKLDEQLMAASKAGSVDAIPGLINSGAYVNFQDGAGTSPLLAATEADKIDVVKVLLQNGADVNLARPDGTSPLLSAYKGNKKKVLKELTAGAFRTLNSAVHQTGTIGGGMMYDPGEDEGVTAMDMCQLRDEAEKLFKLEAHPEVPSPVPVEKRKESMVDLGAPGDISNLRQGGVRLLMQELCQATQKIS
jgi:hypothetical protein